MGAVRNPWARSKTQEKSNEPEYPVAQTSEFAAPSGGAPYTTAFGWSPRLAPNGSTTDLPASQRLGTIPRMDMRPKANRPPEEYWDPIGADHGSRDSAGTPKPLPWEELKSIPKQAALSPYRTPVPEPRITNKLTPAGYSYTRPFDQLNRTHGGDPATGSARHLNGVHFSMADHRRNYEILGMAPQRTRRNTYRIEPGAWDEAIVDVPAPVTQSYAETLHSVAAPARRSYRLGG